jgi:hypothetical protein
MLSFAPLRSLGEANCVRRSAFAGPALLIAEESEMHMPFKPEPPMRLPRIPGPFGDLLGRGTLISAGVLMACLALALLILSSQSRL